MFSLSTYGIGEINVLHRSTWTDYSRPTVSYRLSPILNILPGHIPTLGYSLYIVSVVFDRLSTIIQWYINTAARTIGCFLMQFCRAACCACCCSCTAAKNALLQRQAAVELAVIHQLLTSPRITALTSTMPHFSTYALPQTLTFHSHF